MGKTDLENIKSHIRETASSIHPGVCDAGKHTDIVTKLFLLKRFNDRFAEETEKLVEENDLSDKEAKENKGYHKIFIPEEARWHYIKRQEDIGAAINKASKIIEGKNDNIDQGSLSNIDFENDITSDGLTTLFDRFSQERFRNEDLENPSIVGEAFEWLIWEKKRDKHNDVCMSREVVKLLVDLLDPRPGMEVYDPSCGFCNLLVRVSQHVEEKGANLNDVSLYGQEKIIKDLVSGKINTLLHGISDASLVAGDALINPKFFDGKDLMTFDRVLTGPVWGRNIKYMQQLKNDQLSNRFHYGLPRKTSDTWLWIQHVIASTNDMGKSCVLTNKSFFAGGHKEKEIRSGILKDDLIEAVIALPANLFHSTQVATYILLFNKNKPKDREGEVLFVNAFTQKLHKSGVQVYEESRNADMNTLTDEGAKKIVDTYRRFAEEPRHSRAVNLDEIEEKGWSLDPSEYVGTT